jgi:hypothetical protein
VDSGLCGLKLGSLGSEVSKGGVEPLTVVVSFNIGEQLTFGRLARGIGGMVDELRVGSPLSIGALSQQLPLRLIEARIPLPSASELDFGQFGWMS